jgi:hypothetical protein
LQGLERVASRSVYAGITIMKKIKLTQNKYAMVDDEDYDNLNQYKWRYSLGYAVRTTLAKESSRDERRNVRMHRQIMNCDMDLEVDHIDGDTLNNKKSNLRICTHGQNMSNRKSSSVSGSKYLGVSWHKGNKMWQANITANGKQKNLGYSKTEDECARMYDKAAKELHGSFAALNFD